LPTFRFGLDANLVNGKIYLIGGDDNGSSIVAPSFNEVYDPMTDSWASKASMPTSTEDFASTVFGNKIYIMGGFSKFSRSELNQIYDTETDSWSFGAPVPFDLIVSAAACATTGTEAPKRIYVFGEMWNIGESHRYSVLVYDAEHDSWTAGADIPTDRSGFGVAILYDLIYIIGGETAYPPDISFSYEAPTLTKYATNEQYTPIEYGTILPIVSLVSPLKNQTFNMTNVTLIFTVDKPTVWMGYSLDGQENVTVRSNTTLAGLANGLHNITVFARDEFENTGASEILFFTVELPLPEISPILPVVASAATVAVVGVGLLMYFRKRKR